MQSAIIHEASHAYTNIMGYDGKLMAASSANFSVVRGYREATAITIEEQFRKEMGYQPRDVEKEGGIGINGYGFWPWMTSLPSSNLYGQVHWVGQHNLSLKQGPFIVLDILEKYNELK